MKNVISLFLLLLPAALCVYSSDNDSSDAEYCFSVENNDKSGNAVVKFLLLKKNVRLESIALDTAPESSRFDGSDHRSSWGRFSDFDFADESDNALFGRYAARSTSFANVGCPDSILVELPAVIERRLEKGLKAENLLSLQDRIFNAHISGHLDCRPPPIDTSYRIDFRAKITGKCGYLASKILPLAQ
jgi:hypothetical protein